MIDRLHANWPHVGHIQIGNVPDRHEPGVGDSDLHAVIGEIDGLGWDGWIGLELDPSRDTWSSLMWANLGGGHVAPSPLAARGVLAPRRV